MQKLESAALCLDVCIYASHYTLLSLYRKRTPQAQHQYRRAVPGWQVLGSGASCSAFFFFFLNRIWESMVVFKSQGSYFVCFNLTVRLNNLRFIWDLSQINFYQKSRKPRGLMFPWPPQVISDQKSLSKSRTDVRESAFPREDSLSRFQWSFAVRFPRVIAVELTVRYIYADTVALGFPQTASVWFWKTCRVE